MLRVIQYNVRSFRKQCGNSNVDQLSETLRALNPDVICLNEVNLSKEADALTTLARQVGGFHSAFFGHAMQGQYGNAILSRLPIAKQQHVHLRGGTHVTFPTKQGTTMKKQIVRGLLLCEIPMPDKSNSLHVACTHLDHITQSERKEQVQHLLSIIADLPAESPVLISGDLNALSRNDFSDEEWEDLQSTYSDRGWAGPFDCSSENECLDLLRSNGFHDCGASKSEKAATGEGEKVGSSAATSVHLGARIDYIHVCQRFQAQVGEVVSSHVLASPHTAALSDHYPLVVDFGIASDGSSRL